MHIEWWLASHGRLYSQMYIPGKLGTSLFFFLGGGGNSDFFVRILIKPIWDTVSQINVLSKELYKFFKRNPHGGHCMPQLEIDHCMGSPHGHHSFHLQEQQGVCINKATSIHCECELMSRADVKCHNSEYECLWLILFFIRRLKIIHSSIGRLFLNTRHRH